MSTNTTNKPVTILVVDDNEDDIVFLQQLFAGQAGENQIRAVYDGVEALAYLRREGRYRAADRPGLVLLDINMPRKNGFEVLQEMKADPALRHIPVVMLSSSSREEDLVQSYSHGATWYLTKQSGYSQIEEVVKRIGLHWMLDEESEAVEAHSGNDLEINSCKQAKTYDSKLTNR